MTEDFKPSQEIVAKYLKVLQKYHSDLRQCAAQNDLRGVHAIAHKIRGSAALYNFIELSSIVKEIMEKTDAETPQHLPRLFEELDRIEKQAS